MKLWEFRDFVNERGENLVHTWLHEIPAAARAEVNDLILLLEVRAVDQFTHNDGVGLLRRECSGLIELIIKVGGVQYRLLGYYGPDRKVIMLLVGATERDHKLIPATICRTALNRIDLVARDLERYSCEHDFS